MNEIAWILIIIFISLAALTTLIVCLAKYLSKKIKSIGCLGEEEVQSILGENKPGERYVINDYMIEENGKSSQIDHIIINKNGVFVIETKNFSGEIYGEESQRNWTQSLNGGETINEFYNPVKQNETHKYRVASVLPENTPIIAVVVFVNNNIENVESEQVIGVSDLQSFIEINREHTLSEIEMEEIYNTLLENRSTRTTKEHIADINLMMKKVEENICPRCDGKLVERNGKYGVFMGCSNYPKCKFIKK